jgi:hypothetical protein
VEKFTGGFEPSIISTKRSSTPSTHGHVQASTSKISREKISQIFKKISFCSAWPKPKLITKFAFNTTTHHHYTNF